MANYLKFTALLPLLLSLGLQQLHAAEMVIIADQGGEPAAPYYESRNIGAAAADGSRQQMATLPGRAPQPASIGASARQMLPVTSTLKPGKVQARAITLPGLASPIFIVGDDALSMAWLRQNSQTLIELQAIGWAVSVRDQAALERIKAEVPGIAVQPIQVDDFARRLGLRNYPALITRNAIEQ